MTKFASHLLLAAVLITAGNSQIPLPKRPLGFVYKGGEPTAPIHLEAFVDLTCPDCQQAWPTLKKVADMYGPETVQFTLQLFPLPYHTNAFLAAQSVYAVEAYNTSLVISWMDVIFENQNQLYDFQTMDKNRYDVINIIADLGSKIDIDKTVIKDGLTNTKYNEHTRISWKYGCSRTVSGTPFFFLNGVFVSQASAAWTVEEWKLLIDPLLKLDVRDFLKL
ncbi:hypothetical protein pdam_00006876 [Pocillopora damicornis]|uniref:Thioredoxin-like fold domain-containing protein n=1 Tax=Pocillopora damicornis TaxID=46731 RepID=A0A3M6TP49_POCDA|nr:uncharacterized protein LOC113675190 [Pocillopora damicornis]RMX43150.1 hypothetical protein pdam_00006876 [Pocillopora damicornis]